jgi:hypothetical protein
MLFYVYYRMSDVLSLANEAFMAARLARKEQNDVVELTMLIRGITFQSILLQDESTTNDDKKILCFHIHNHSKRCDDIKTKIQVLEYDS